MKIALFQSVVCDDMQANAVKALDAMDIAITSGADVISFPELQFSPFFPQYPGRDVSNYVMDINHELVEALRAKCRETSLIAIPNFYLERNGKRYDASPVINADGSILGVSSMVHVAQVQSFYEQDYYTPSPSGFHDYDTSLGKIGVVICFDRH